MIKEHKKQQQQPHHRITPHHLNDNDLNVRKTSPELQLNRHLNRQIPFSITT